jgi:hypothetical protein
VRKYTFLFIIFSFLLAACVKAPEFSDVPEISFVSVSKVTMMQNDLPTDSVFVTFSFTDGDGDLGSGPNGAFNIFLTDTRTGFQENKFRIPEIPQAGTANGIEGEVRVLLFTTCCIFSDSRPPCTTSPMEPTNDLSYEIYIEDRAGNQSNVIETSLITLVCE